MNAFWKRRRRRKPDAGNLHVRFDEGEGSGGHWAWALFIPCSPLYSTGTGPLTKLGGGTLTLGGGDPNAYTGDTLVNEGTLQLGKTIAITAVPGRLIVGSSAGLPAVARNLNGYQIVGDISVNRNGLHHVNGQAENVTTLTLSEGGDVETGTGTLLFRTGVSIQVTPGGVLDSSRVRGNLGFDAGSHDFVVGRRSSGDGDAELVIDAVISESGGAASFQKSGLGTLRLTGNNAYTGPTTVTTGTLQVDGNQPGSNVAIGSGAQLGGMGRVGAIEFLSGRGEPGIVSPGDRLGVLSAASFNAGGSRGVLRIELNGLTPGHNGYNQLYVRSATGAANLNGVTLEASLGFRSSVNDRFTILNKDGTRGVTGQFEGLPEGANFYISGEKFTITYGGGTGNDVVLSRLETPRAEVTTLPATEAPNFVTIQVKICG